MRRARTAVPVIGHTSFQTQRDGGFADSSRRVVARVTLDGTAAFDEIFRPTCPQIPHIAIGPRA